MTARLSKTDEIVIEEVKENARKIAEESENEMQAIAQINQIEGVKIQRSHSNGATGSFTFYLLIDLENRQKTDFFTHRFPIAEAG